MTTFIQLHLLTNYAPSNLNRDDLGRPKTAIMGGVERFRISSQSNKRSWRISDVFTEAMNGFIGIRTKKFGEKVFTALMEKGVDVKKAEKWAKEIASQFGKVKAKGLEIEQLAHIAPEEQDAALMLVNKLVETNEDPTETDLSLLRKNVHAVDIALFGRMLASSPAFNIEAAVQVAHSITVNRVVVEDDYFTAVDDLNSNDVDSGSAHIGESGFGSGLFYTYICINKTLLTDNLQDETLAKKAIAALVEAAATVSPGGKQNSFASRSRALYILAEKGSQQPRQLSSAFLKPVDSPDMLSDSVSRIETLSKNMDSVYGSCAEARYSINVEKGEGSFKELLAFVGE